MEHRLDAPHHDPTRMIKGNVVTQTRNLIKDETRHNYSITCFSLLESNSMLLNFFQDNNNYSYALFDIKLVVVGLSRILIIILKGRRTRQPLVY